MRLEAAREEETMAVCRFYEEVCRFQETQPYGPKWHYGLYPTPEDLAEHVRGGRMYLLRQDGAIAAALALPRGEDPMYRDVPFTVRTEPVFVLHLFAVHPDFRGRGLGRAALRALLKLARDEGARAIHFDVVAGNLPAERLYQSLGFRFVQEREVWYPDTGDVTVRLYEYDLTGTA